MMVNCTIGLEINIRFGCFLSFRIFSTSRLVASFLPSFLVVLEIPIMSRLLFCTCFKTSARYFGRSPQTGDAYSRSGRPFLCNILWCQSPLVDLLFYIHAE